MKKKRLRNFLKDGRRESRKNEKRGRRRGWERD
jgi:hypothetical protein